MDNDLPPHTAPFALRVFMAFVLIGASDAYVSG
jgi:hypothetical protein